MALKLFIATIFIVLTFFVTSFAQKNPQKNACPNIKLLGPTITVQTSDILTFIVDVKNFNTSEVNYKWTVISGEIASGQETNKIVVNTDNFQNTKLKATVEINNLPTICKNIYSHTVTIARPTGDRIRTFIYDEYKNLSDKKEKERLDNVAIELSISEIFNAFFLVYYSKNTSKPELKKKRLLFIENHLTKTRKIQPNRLKFKLIKDKENKTAVYLQLPKDKEGNSNWKELLDNKDF